MLDWSVRRDAVSYRVFIIFKEHRPMIVGAGREIYIAILHPCCFERNRPEIIDIRQTLCVLWMLGFTLSHISGSTGWNSQSQLPVSYICVPTYFPLV